MSILYPLLTIVGVFGGGVLLALAFALFLIRPKPSKETLERRHEMKKAIHRWLLPIGMLIVFILATIGFSAILTYFNAPSELTSILTPIVSGTLAFFIFFACSKQTHSDFLDDKGSLSLLVLILFGLLICSSFGIFPPSDY